MRFGGRSDQNPRARRVDHEADDGDQQCLVEGNLDGVYQSLRALDDHDKGEPKEHHRAREPGEAVDLAHPERKPAV